MKTANTRVAIETTYLTGFLSFKTSGRKRAVIRKIYNTNTDDAQRSYLQRLPHGQFGQMLIADRHIAEVAAIRLDRCGAIPRDGARHGVTGLDVGRETL